MRGGIRREGATRRRWWVRGTTWRRLHFIELVGVCRAKQKHIKLGEKYGNQLLFFFSTLTSTSPHCTSPNLPHDHPYLWHFLSLLSDLLFSPLSSYLLLSFAFLSSNSASLRPIQCGFTVLWSSSTSKGAHELIKSVGGTDMEGGNSQKKVVKIEDYQIKTRNFTSTHFKMKFDFGSPAVEIRSWEKNMIIRETKTRGGGKTDFRSRTGGEGKDSAGQKE